MGMIVDLTQDKIYKYLKWTIMEGGHREQRGAGMMERSGSVLRR
jgi:hypothetical protein